MGTLTLEGYKARAEAREQARHNRAWAYATFNRIKALPREECLREAHRIATGDWKADCIRGLLVPMLWNLIAQLQPDAPLPKVKGRRMTHGERSRRYREAQRIKLAHVAAERMCCHVK